MTSVFHLSRFVKVVIAGVIGGIIAALAGSVPVCAEYVARVESELLNPSLEQFFCPLSLHRVWIFSVWTPRWYGSFILDTILIAIIVYVVLSVIEWLFHRHEKKHATGR